MFDFTKSEFDDQWKSIMMLLDRTNVLNDESARRPRKQLSGLVQLQPTSRGGSRKGLTTSKRRRQTTDSATYGLQTSTGRLRLPTSPSRSPQRLTNPLWIKPRLPSQRTGESSRRSTVRFRRAARARAQALAEHHVSAACLIPGITSCPTWQSRASVAALRGRRHEVEVFTKTIGPSLA